MTSIIKLVCFARIKPQYWINNLHYSSNMLWQGCFFHGSINTYWLPAKITKMSVFTSCFRTKHSKILLKSRNVVTLFRPVCFYIDSIVEFAKFYDIIEIYLIKKAQENSKNSKQNFLYKFNIRFKKHKKVSVSLDTFHV